MPSLVLTFPLVAGKVEAWRRFCQALAGFRLPAYEASRLRLNITREQWGLVETQFGATAVVTFEAVDLGAAVSQMVLSPLPFERWYREQVQELYGIQWVSDELLPSVLLPTQYAVHFEWPPRPAV